jgi:hypothetical protein
MPTETCPRSTRWAIPLVVFALGVGACAEGTGADGDLLLPDLPDASRGAIAFGESCAGCHSSGDGFDLARFGFADSTVLRRATAHVDTATALDIIAHVRNLGVSPVDRDVRLFQPRGELAENDLSFALAAFGRDAWPEGWGEDDVLSVDPLDLLWAVPFPVWSDEESSLDWMPNRPPSDEILDARGGLARGALGAYAAAPTEENLDRAMQALRLVSHDRTSPVAPCAQTGDGALAEPAECFEITRWTATLAGQHLLRFGLSFDGDIAGGTRAQDAFWDVGQAARRGLLKNRRPVDHAEENWVSWMVLGWVFAPENHASGYTASGLARIGLPRHATFVALRSLAARAPGTDQPYRDLRVAAAQAPSAWLAAAITTGVAILESREARGETPTSTVRRAEAAAALESTIATLRRRMGVVASATLVSRLQALDGFGSGVAAFN